MPAQKTKPANKTLADKVALANKQQAASIPGEELKKNELYQFTIYHLQEAVFWVNEDGFILHVNNGAAELSGYTKEELIKLYFYDVNQTVQADNWQFVWNRLREQKKVTFDAKFKRKNGEIIDIEITQNFLSYNGIEYACSIARDLRKRKLEQDLLQTISEATSGYVGYDYFRELTKYITLTMSVKYSLITECANEEKTRVRTISFVDH